jgi:hypothetical protein
VASSARDMGAYLAFMQRRGIAPDGTRLISVAGFERMTTRQSTGGAYGYGWDILPNAIRHAGLDAGFEALVWSRTKSPVWGFVILATFSNCSAESVLALGGIQRMTRAVGSVLGTWESPPPPSRLQLYRSVVRLIAVLVLAAITASALSLRRWLRPSSRDHAARLTRGLRATAALALHLVLPVAALVFTPILVATPWSTLVLFAPDTALLILVFSISELCIGVIKAGLLIIRDIHARPTSTSN